MTGFTIGEIAKRARLAASRRSSLLPLAEWEKPTSNRFFRMLLTTARRRVGAGMSADRPMFLGDLEGPVMDHLWSVGLAEVKDVHRSVGRPRRITLNTVQTTLKRLYEKGLLTREKVSHAFAYAPAMSREEYQRRTLDQTIGLLMRGEQEAMVSAFVDLAERAGAMQLERLERMVAERLAKRERVSR